MTAHCDKCRFSDACRRMFGPAWNAKSSGGVGCEYPPGHLPMNEEKSAPTMREADVIPPSARPMREKISIDAVRARLLAQMRR